MKKIIPICLVGILLCTAFGAAAGSNSAVEINETNQEKTDYTHTVFVEVGTSTTCPACPASNIAWHNIYEQGTYNFQYTEMVVNKNPVANARMNADYNLYWVPTSYFDGGQFVYPGTNINTFKNNLNSCGARTVADLQADLNIYWLGSAKIQVDINVTNNEAESYLGHLRVYVIELQSTLWKDYNGNWYYHAFLDFVFNEPIEILAGETLTDTTIWDGAAHGYSGITPGNIQVILAVFDDEQHQAFSDPPSGAPFWAYYVDETVAATIQVPPNTPSNPYPANGATNIDINADLSWTGGDPNPHDTVTYDVYFGTTSPPPKVASNISTASYNVGTMDFETMYYWKIVSWDQHGATAEGPAWSFTTMDMPNNAPETPTFTGPDTGKPGNTYKYTITATDSDNDMIYGYIEWGDGTTTEWVGPYASGQSFSLTHTWTEKGTYTVKAKVRDEHGAESDWATLDVTMPKSFSITSPFLTWLFQHFPYAFPLLRKLLGI